MMPENLPALAAYWTDRDNQNITIDDRPASGDAPHRPLDQGRGFTGLQGQLWSETIRNRETLGYQMLPRMFALAERAWHRAPWEAPYDRAGRVVEYGDDIVDAQRLAAMAHLYATHTRPQGHSKCCGRSAASIPGGRQKTSYICNASIIKWK